MDFVAEVKQVKQLKLASLDNQYTVTLRTDDSKIMDLGKLPPDVLVKVTVEEVD